MKWARVAGVNDDDANDDIGSTRRAQHHHQRLKGRIEGRRKERRRRKGELPHAAGLLGIKRHSHRGLGMAGVGRMR